MLVVVVTMLPRCGVSAVTYAATTAALLIHRSLVVCKIQNMF